MTKTQKRLVGLRESLRFALEQRDYALNMYQIAKDALASEQAKVDAKRVEIAELEQKANEEAFWELSDDQKLLEVTSLEELS